jgi:hypothetical protein
MKLSIERITPDIAHQLLANNKSNRPISEMIVRKYAEDMRMGRWKSCNGETITIAKNGNLFNGQHRLRAIILADMSFDMGIARDVEDDVFDTIDAGKSRNPSDILAMRGYSNTSTLASAARIAYSYCTGLGQSHTPSRMARTDFVEAHPYLNTICKQVRNDSKLKVYPGPLIAVLALANSERKYDEEIRQFLEGLATGANLSKGDPRLTLRDWNASIRSRNNGKVTVQSSFAFAAIVRAWNAFATDRQLTYIRALDQTSSADLPIVGFNRMMFQDVPYLARQTPELTSFAEVAKKPAKVSA